MGRKKTPVFLNPESVWGNVCWWVFHQCWPDYLPANSSSQSSKESVRFPGIPVLAERLMFLSQGCWPAVMLDRRGSSLSQLEWKGRIVVVCIDVTDTGSKKGTEKQNENIFSSLLLLWAFLLDWGKILLCGRREGWWRVTWEMIAFRNCMANLPYWLFSLPGKDSTFFYTYLGDIFCTQIHLSENWLPLRLFFSFTLRFILLPYLS